MDMDRSSDHVGVTQHLSELRIVLVGAENSGISSAGNIILGKQEFTPGIKTLACKKVQANVAGRQVSVVDTPGWVNYFPVEDSPELLKDHIMCSVPLCAPGPHAFILVIDLDSTFLEQHLRAVQEHLELLSDTVWRHTILLFMCGDTLKEMTIDQQAHQMLLEKCGNRYHVLYNKTSGEDSHVTELLEMIEKMVAGNSGCHFHMERKLLQGLEKKRRNAEERANQRVKNVLAHRLILQDLLKGQACRPSELKVVLLGWVAGGKSSTGNTILGREEFGVWRRTAQCEKKQGEVNGRQITVVDTPGWWKFLAAKFTPDWIKQEVQKSLSLCHPGPHAILLVIPADTSFKEEQKKIIRDNMKHLGEKVWGHTLVLFTWGEYLGNSSIEQHIEREGQALQWLIKKCGNRYHVLSNMKKGDGTQVTELLEKIEEMVAGRTVFHPKTQTHIEVIEEIEEMDIETRGGDLRTEQQKITELMQIIDELWIKREDLLEKLGWKWKGKSEALPPARLQKVFEMEWSRIETGLKLMEIIQERNTPPNRAGSIETPSYGGDTVSESRSFIENVGSGEEAYALKEEAIKAATVFEKEWGRREWGMFHHFRRMIQDCASIPVREGRSMDEPLNLCGDRDTSSEPDSSRLAVSCIKVCDWMREKHSGNSAGASGYETSSEVSNTETSDITGRDEGLEHCETVHA